MPPIRISKDGQVIDKVVKARKGRNEDVEWIAQDGGGPWTITFDKVSTEPSTYPVAPDSPFSQPTYTVDKGGRRSTTGGPVKGVANRTYRYRVRDAAGNITHDPDIDIET
jgi:hypothetical protein